MRFLTAAFLSLTAVAPVTAGTIISEYPNYVAGPIVGNDNASNVSDILGFEVDLVGKFDDIDEDGTWDAQGLANQLHLTFEDQGLKFFFASGVMKGEVLGDGFDYLAAKGGNEFYVFEAGEFGVTPWHIGCHFISHVSLYSKPPVHVPEPSGMVLGLLALCGLGLRRIV